jgi:ABC-type Fe3+/spermidine/putrescine transport system ATPase subunit
MVMQDGRFAQSAAPAELYRRPVTREVARLKGAAAVLPGRAVDVLLRPDQIVCGEAGQGAVAATVIGAAFQGDHSVVTIEAGCVRLDLPLRLVGVVPAIIHLRIDGKCMAYSCERSA